MKCAKETEGKKAESVECESGCRRRRRRRMRTNDRETARADRFWLFLIGNGASVSFVLFFFFFLFSFLFPPFFPFRAGDVCTASRGVSALFADAGGRASSIIHGGDEFRGSRDGVTPFTWRLITAQPTRTCEKQRNNWRSLLRTNGVNSWEVKGK